MVNIKYLFLFFMLIMVWSCKGKASESEIPLADTQSEIVDSSTILSPNTSDTSVLVITNEKGTMIEQKSSNSKPTQKTSESKISTTSKNSNIDNSKLPSEIKKPALKPVSEPVKDISTTAQDAKNNTKASSNNPIDHQLFDQQLKKYVASGIVNYKAWKKDMNGLNEYLKNISAAQNIDKWSNEEKLAFWINTYNASTVKLVLDNYPVKSIKDINNGKPWDKKFIQIGSTSYSLNDIENEIIRKKFSEPRIHFAVNCAAKSCPILVNKAFTKDNLNSLLESNAKSFINGPQNSVSKDKLEISHIFDWYGVDFDNVITFISKYAQVKPNSNAKISFKTYNWALNE